MNNIHSHNTYYNIFLKTTTKFLGPTIIAAFSILATITILTTLAILASRR